MKKRVVVALGGNALGNSLPEQKIAVKSTAKTIIDLVEADCDVVVTHGNGPQIGMINNAMAALTREVEGQPNTPLSVCVAMSQAYIGYDLQNALHEELLNRGIKDLPTMTMVTQVLVDQNDPAFQNPTKPIGHFMTQEEAEYAEKNYDYVVKEDAGRGYRRVVASPAPKEIIELEAIKGFTELGSGFKIAMRDLSIRGAGNILGASQSGFIDSVGFEMYSQLLEEAIAKKQGKEQKRQKSNAEINLQIDAYLPSDYISDERQKIEIYKRIREIDNSVNYEDLQEELIDRFGEYPDVVAYLLEIGLLKSYLDKSFVSLVERRQQTVVVRFEKMSQQIFLTQDYFEALAATTLKARIGESDKLIEVIFDVRQKKDYEILENLIQFGQKLVEIKQRKED